MEGDPRAMKRKLASVLAYSKLSSHLWESQVMKCLKKYRYSHLENANGISTSEIADGLNFLRAVLGLTLTLGAMFAALASAHATDYAWTPTGAGTFNWDNSGPEDNWGTGAGGAFPNATADTANMGLALAGDQVVNLNQEIAIGSLTFGSSTGTFKTTINSGGTSLTFDNGGSGASITRIAGGTGDTVINAPIVLADNLTLNHNATTASFQFNLMGTISDTGGPRSITFNGNAAVNSYNVHGNNTYSGDTIITSSSIAFHNGYAIPDGPGKGNVSVGNGAYLLLGADETINGLTGVAGAKLRPINSGGSRKLTLGAGDATGYNYGGGLADRTTARFLNVTKTGTGTQILSGTNSYTGVTIIEAGTLHFARRASLYNSAPASWTDAKITVNSDATAAFNVGGTGEFIDTDITTLSALGTATGGFQSGSFIGLDTTNASGSEFVYNPVIADTNGGSNSIGLVKLGTNKLTLNGTNTYSGPTTVNAGSLGGTGSVLNSTVTVYGDAAIAPGASVGTFSVGGLVLKDNANLNFELENSAGAHSAGAGSDFLDIVGMLDLSTISTLLTLDVDAAGGGDLAVAGSWVLASFDDSNFGSFNINSINVTGIDPGYSHSLSVVSTGGTTGNIVLATDSANLPGDYNGDHIVDAADYVYWRKHDSGNPNGYATWRQYFGTGSGAGSGLGTVSAVPEPAACTLLLAVLLAGLASRKLQR
ncbi:MAG: autotransporter-associated beta strand repeat-containing protein [Pirellulales bacterium]|nr:autotransporter-associated beta strand repeat-containing protein [Pirellulales bacterium]